MLSSGALPSDRVLSQDRGEEGRLRTNPGSRCFPGAGLGGARHHHQRRGGEHCWPFPRTRLSVRSRSLVNAVAPKDTDQLA